MVYGRNFCCHLAIDYTYNVTIDLQRIGGQPSKTVKLPTLKGS